MPAPSLPLYGCHKTVNAAPIARIFEPAAVNASGLLSNATLILEIEGDPDGPFEYQVDAEWYKKHNPDPGWWLVVYDAGTPDEYVSASPGDKFEAGYHGPLPQADDPLGQRGKWLKQSKQAEPAAVFPKGLNEIATSEGCVLLIDADGKLWHWCAGRDLKPVKVAQP